MFAKVNVEWLQMEELWQMIRIFWSFSVQWIFIDLIFHLKVASSIWWNYFDKVFSFYQQLEQIIFIDYLKIGLLGHQTTSLLSVVFICFLSKRSSRFHNVIGRMLLHWQSRRQVHHCIPLPVAEMIKAKHADLKCFMRKRLTSVI